MQNCFSQNPPKIAIYKGNSIVKIYCVIGQVSENIKNAILKNNASTLENHYGHHYKNKLLMTDLAIKKVLDGPDAAINGGDEGENLEEDISFSELTNNVEELLKVPEQEVITTHRKPRENRELVEYIFDVQIFPEDKLHELREKIMLISGIEYYRQHVFYTGGTTYKLSIGEPYPIDILAPAGAQMFGIPIDRHLYDFREDITVEAIEYFQLLETCRTYYVKDLNDYLTEYTQLKNSVSDSYIMNLIYYGFIIKYFPVLSFEAFYDLINNQDTFTAKYPEIIKDFKTLEHKYKYEMQIINEVYNTKAKTPLNVSIVRSAITASAYGVIVNIRNLFDVLDTSIHIPYIRAYVNYGGENYQLNKKTQLLSNVPIPSKAQISKGIIIALNIKGENLTSETIDKSNYIYINLNINGDYSVLSSWNEEDEMTFDKMRNVAIKFVNPLIRKINKYNQNIISGELPELKNIKYKTLSIDLVWDKILNSDQYKSFKNNFHTYFESGIMLPHPIKLTSGYEILFCKGMYDYDKNKLFKIFSTNGSNILFNNQYNNLTSQAIKQKWSQHYVGKNIHIHHQITSIKFEIFNVNEGEFALINNYFQTLIQKFTSSKKFANEKAVNTTVKRLKKLKETDPELYNIKKYSGKKVYSVLCQGDHQPVIYKESEIKELGIKNAVKYWNFTKQAPAYYSCPNKKYPHLSFIVGMHPKNYCLPCCHKKEKFQDSKKGEINASCISQHVITDELNTSAKYVFQYKHDVDIGRLSYLPTYLSKIAEINQQQLFVLFLERGYKHLSNVDILYAMSVVMKKSIPTIINEIIKAFRSSPTNYYLLINGKMNEYFETNDAFLSAISDYFLDGKLISVWAKGTVDWNQIFLDIFTIHYQFQIIIDNIDSEKEILSPTMRTHIYLENKTQGSDFVILIHQEDNYNLVVNRDQTTALLKQGNLFLDFLLETIKETKNHSRIISLTSIKKLKQYTIVAKMINKTGLCYAVLLSRDKMTLYVPVKYVVNISDGIPEKYTMEIGNATYEDLQKFVVIYNKENQYKFIQFQYVAHCVGCSALFTTGKLMFYLRDNADIPKMPSRNWYADPIQVANDILQRVDIVENDMNKFIGRAIYNNYIYQLIVLEFVAFISRDKNKKMRNKIIKSFETKTPLPKCDNETDNHILADLEKNADTFLDELDKIRFAFDDITINELRSLNGDEMIGRIKELLLEITINKEPSLIGKIDNIFSPCSTNLESKLCKDKKLMVKDVGVYAKLLAKDIMENKYFVQEIGESSKYINFLDFNNQANSVVEILKV